MIPAAHRAHYLSVTADLLLGEMHGADIRDTAAARIVALAEQIAEIAGALRNELAVQDNAGNGPPPNEPATLGSNVVSLPLRAVRRS